MPPSSPQKVWIVHVNSAVQGVYATFEAARAGVVVWAAARKGEGWHEVRPYLWANMDHNHLTIRDHEVQT